MNGNLSVLSALESLFLKLDLGNKYDMNISLNLIFLLMWPLSCLRPQPPDWTCLSRPRPPVWGRLSWAANILIKKLITRIWKIAGQVKLDLAAEWPPGSAALVHSYLTKEHFLEEHWSPIWFTTSPWWIAGWWLWTVSSRGTDWC